MKATRLEMFERAVAACEVRREALEAEARSRKKKAPVQITSEQSAPLTALLEREAAYRAERAKLSLTGRIMGDPLPSRSALGRVCP